MFKKYKDLCDVVSLLVHCPSERAYLLTKEPSGEFWIPCSKAEKSCWKLTAHKMHLEVFGAEAGQCTLIRVYKVWLPNHPQSYVFHAVYKCHVKADVKKKTKLKANVRNRLQWLTMVELERQRAHSNLRSPEIAAFASLALAELQKEANDMEELGVVVELCEDNVIVSSEATGGAVNTAPNYQLLQAAGYTREDQIRMYREFLVLVFPALYMSAHIFTQLMMDVGWQRSQCLSLFRAADVTGRGGLSFLELMLWSAALEPGTQHSGIPAEIRCRYIFRYFDGNRDQKLEYTEFKELLGAARAARQLPVDALSVARDADSCLRQLGVQPNCQLSLTDFLRGVGELRLRGTSSLLRAPRGISEYLADLQEREHDLAVAPKTVGRQPSTGTVMSQRVGSGAVRVGAAGGPPSATRRAPPLRPDYCIASHTMRLRKKQPNEMIELSNFAEDAVSASTARLVGCALTSAEVLGAASAPVEAMAAVHYFATPAVKHTKRATASTICVEEKAAWSWSAASEQAAFGALLLRLAEGVRVLCLAEPRLLRINSPAYVIGDLHGNLSALLTMEEALWPMGVALGAGRLLFLGDYVDRGPHGAELLAYLLAAKLQRPHAVLLVRGNHEIRDIQKMFTFHTECVCKYGEIEGPKIWAAINNVFDVLPLAAVVDDKVFCCHGGIPPPWVCPLITAIDKVPAPLPRPADQSSIAWELLWNDPVKTNKMTASLALELAANEGFTRNAKRGTGHVFDQAALDRFLLANQLSHVVRAHELHQNGFMCQLRGKLISVFSSSHYCGGTNDSGVALLDAGKLRLIRVNEHS